MATEMNEIGVGDFVYEFDGNRRHYKPDEHGHQRVVFAKHFQRFRVTGEEGRSLLIETEGKWPFRSKIGKGALGKGKWFTEKQYRDRLWEREHRATISRAFDRADTPTLRRIAALLDLPFADD